MLTLVAAICMLLPISKNFADNKISDNKKDPSHKRDGFYLLAAIGSSANTDYAPYDASNAPVVTNDSNYTSYRIGLGYLRPVAEKVSLGGEFAYNYYGSERYNYLNLDSAEIDYSAIDILGVIALRVNNYWSLKAKAGVAYESIDATEEGFNASLSEKQWLPEVGGGLAYSVSESFEVEGSFSYILGNVSTVNNAPDITVLWIGLNYYL